MIGRILQKWSSDYLGLGMASPRYGRSVVAWSRESKVWGMGIGLGHWNWDYINLVGGKDLRGIPHWVGNLVGERRHGGVKCCS